MKSIRIAAIAVVVLGACLAGCGSPKTVRAVGTRLERGIDFSDQNGQALIDALEDSREFAIKEHRRMVVRDFARAKIQATAPIPAGLIAKLRVAAANGNVPAELVNEFEAAQIKASATMPDDIVQAFTERLDKNDAKHDELRSEMGLKRKIHSANTEEMRRALRLIYAASEAWGDEETVNARIDELSGMVRILLQTYAADKAKAAKP